MRPFGLMQAIGSMSVIRGRNALVRRDGTPPCCAMLHAMGSGLHSDRPLVEYHGSGTVHGAHSQMLDGEGANAARFVGS